MEMEFKVLRYPNTSEGQQSKVGDLRRFSSLGWEVVSETIELSEVDPVAAGRDAACLCFLCGPFCAPFLMNPGKYKSRSIITVTIQRSLEKRDEVEALRAQRDFEARKVAELRRLEESADINMILDQAKLDLGAFYPDSRLIDAIQRYLEEERETGGDVPSYAKSSVGQSEIVVRNSFGEELFRYPIG